MLLGAYGCATAPPAVTFSDLAARVARGNTVYVTDAAGRERKGRIGAVSADALTLEVDGTRQVIEARDVRQVERYGDALWVRCLRTRCGVCSTWSQDSRCTPRSRRIRFR
jgi:hypothetical protein